MKDKEKRPKRTNETDLLTLPQNTRREFVEKAGKFVLAGMGYEIMSLLPVLIPDGASAGVGGARPQEANIVKWKFRTSEGNFSTPAIASDGSIYFASKRRSSRGKTGWLYAISSNDTLKWSYKLSKGGFTSSPAVGADGTTYIHVCEDYKKNSSGLCEKGALYAINSSGKLKWKFYYKKMMIESTPVVDSKGVIYFSDKWGKSKVYAVTSDGKLKWKYNKRYNPAIGPDGNIYVGGKGGVLYAINPDGKQKMKFKPRDGSGFPSPVIGPNGVVYYRSNENLYAVNPDGTLRWKFGECGSGHWKPIVGPDGTVYIGLLAIGPDGKLKWKSHIKVLDTYSYDCYSDISSPNMIKMKFHSYPVIGVDGTLYVAGDNLNLYAINPDGTQKWRYTVRELKNELNRRSWRGKITTYTPTLTMGRNGTIYLGTEGYLYAIDPSIAAKYCSVCTGTCTQSCTMSCTKKCIYACIESCTASCTKSCTSSCIGGCTECTSGCTGCTSGCTYGCTGGCTKCTISCISSCTVSCTSGCTRSCTYGCTSGCTTCTGVTTTCTYGRPS